MFGEPNLSGKYTVEQDGTFTFPQIGRIKAGGLTLRALEQELRKQLADGYLRNPQVAVAIENYRSQRILILGEVRSPGEYQLTGEHDAARGARARRIDDDRPPAARR